MITFDPDAVRARLRALEDELGAPGFWDDQERAAAVSAEHARVTRRLERYVRLQREYDDAQELFAMDGDLADELEAHLAPLRGELERLQEDALFTGEYDAGDAVVTIHAGTGGTDAQDWAEILLRMYLRWAEDRGFATELVEASPGEEAGLKSATFTVRGDNAYGILKAERGVHRLVRLSPFDSAHRRHTSFAQVIVSPLVSDDVDIELDILGNRFNYDRWSFQTKDKPSIGELLQKTVDDLLAITNFGQKSLDEVIAKLDERGLSLRTKD